MMISDCNLQSSAKFRFCVFQEGVNEVMPHQLFEKRRCPFLAPSPTNTCSDVILEVDDYGLKQNVNDKVEGHGSVLPRPSCALLDCILLLS